MWISSVFVQIFTNYHNIQEAGYRIWSIRSSSDFLESSGWVLRTLQTFLVHLGVGTAAPGYKNQFWGHFFGFRHFGTHRAYRYTHHTFPVQMAVKVENLNFPNLLAILKSVENWASEVLSRIIWHPEELTSEHRKGFLTWRKNTFCNVLKLFFIWFWIKNRDKIADLKINLTFF